MAALSVHLHWEGSKFNFSELNASFTRKEINGMGRLGFYLLQHTKMSFFLMYSNLSLPCGFTHLFLPLKPDLCFTFTPMECTEEMIRVTSAYSSGKGVFYPQFSCMLSSLRACLHSELLLSTARSPFPGAGKTWLYLDQLFHNVSDVFLRETFWFNIHKEMG